MHWNKYPNTKKKNETWPSLIQHTKSNLTQTMNLNRKSINLPINTLESIFTTLELTNSTLNKIVEALTIEEKNDKLDFIKMLNFCPWKDTTEKINRQATV